MTAKMEGNPPPVPAEKVEEYKKSIEEAAIIEDESKKKNKSFSQIMEIIPDENKQQFRSRISKDSIKEEAIDRIAGERGILVGTKGEKIDRLIGDLTGVGAKKSLDILLEDIDLDDFTQEGLELILISLGEAVGKRGSKELRGYIINKLNSLDKNKEPEVQDETSKGGTKEPVSGSEKGGNEEDEEIINTSETEANPESVLNFAEMHEEYQKRGLIEKSDKSSTGYIFTEKSSSLDRELIISRFIEDLKKKGEEENKDEIEKWDSRLTSNDKTVSEWINEWEKSLKEKSVLVNFEFSEEELEQKPAKLIEIRKIFEDQIRELDKKAQTGEPNPLWQIISFVEAEMRDSGTEAPSGEELGEEVPSPGEKTEEPETLITEEELKNLRGSYLEILHQRERKFFTWLKSKFLRSYREGYYSEESLSKAKEDYEEGASKYRQQEIKKYTNGIEVDGYTVRDAEGNVLGVVGQDQKTFDDILAEKMTQIEWLLQMKEKDEVSKEEALIVSGDLGYKFGKLVKRHPGVRAAIGFGLTGLAFASLATGAVPLAGVALGLRAGWAGISATVGTEGLLQFTGEKVSRWRGNMKKLSPDELKGMSDQDLAFRLCAFQENQAKKGDTLGELSPKELEKYNTLEQAAREKREEELRRRLVEYRGKNPDATLEEIKTFFTEDYLRGQISEETAIHERMIARRKKFAIAKWITAIAAGSVATTLACIKFGGGKGGGTKPPADKPTIVPDRPPTPTQENVLWGEVNPSRLRSGGASNDIYRAWESQYLSGHPGARPLSQIQQYRLEDSILDPIFHPHPSDHTLYDGFRQAITPDQYEAYRNSVF